MARWASGFLIASVVSLAAVDAHGQVESSEAAQARRELIARAQEASDHGDSVTALEIATRAAVIEMTPSLRLFIAEQQARSGRWLDAFASASLCEHEAGDHPDLANHEAIGAACHELVGETQSHLARLHLRIVGSDRNAITVLVNGRSVAIDERAIATDPGPIVVEARRDTRVIARSDVVVASGGSADITLDVTPRMTSLTTHTTGFARASHRSGPSVGPLVVGGAGLASVVVSAVFFGLREGARGNCTQEGTALVCPTAADGLRAQNAITYNTVADVTLGVGLAALAGGALWFVLDRTGHRNERVHAGLAPTPAGVFASVGWSL